MPPAEKPRGLFFCVLRVGLHEPTLCFLYQLIAPQGCADTRLEKPIANCKFPQTAPVQNLFWYNGLYQNEFGVLKLI